MLERRCVCVCVVFNQRLYFQSQLFPKPQPVYQTPECCWHFSCVHWSSNFQTKKLLIHNKKKTHENNTAKSNLNSLFRF